MASSNGLPTRDPLHPILDTYLEVKAEGKDPYLGLDSKGNLICKVYEKTIFSSRPKTIKNEFDLRNGSGKRTIIKVEIDKAVPDKKIDELTSSLFSYSPQKKESGYKSASARSREESPVLVSTPSRESSISDEFELVERPLDAREASLRLLKTYEKLFNIYDGPSLISQEDLLDVKREAISFQRLEEVLPLVLEEENPPLNKEQTEELQGVCLEIHTLIRKINEKVDVQNFANCFSASIMESSLREVASLTEAKKEQAANALIDEGIDEAEKRILENLFNSLANRGVDEQIERFKKELNELRQATNSITIPDLEEFLLDVTQLKALSYEDEILEDSADSSFGEKLTELRKKFGALNSLLEAKSDPIESLISSVRGNRFFSTEEKADLLKRLDTINKNLEEKKKVLQEALLPLGELNQLCQKRQLIRKEILEDGIKALSDFKGTPLFSIKDGRLMIEKKGLFDSNPSIKIGKKALHFKEANRAEILKLLEFTSVYEAQKFGADGTQIARMSSDLKPINSRLQPLKVEFKQLLLEKLS